MLPTQTAEGQAQIIEESAARVRLDDRTDVALAKHSDIDTPERIRRFRQGYADRYFARCRRLSDADYLAGYDACDEDDGAELRGHVARYDRPRFAAAIAEADPRFRGLDYEGDDAHDH